jgi:hypothetical protein
MRPAEGKEYLWLNDHTGNANRYGWFADIHHDKLDCTPPHIKGEAYLQEEKAPQEIKRKQCTSCRQMLPRGALKCGFCGFQIVVEDVTTIDGELIDIRNAAKEAKAKREREKHRKEQQRWLSGFLWIAKRQGFKPDWAKFRFQEKFGSWPNGELKCVARKPVPEVLEADEKRRKEYVAAKKQADVVPEYHGEF